MPYNLVHRCALMLSPAELIEDARVLMELELTKELWNQMFFMFLGRRDIPDCMQ